MPVVLIASPSAKLRTRWREGLDPRFGVHQAARRATLEWRLAAFRPAVLLLDAALPGLKGAAGIAALQQLSPATKIVLLSRRPSEREGIAALKGGAKGYCHVEVSSALLRKTVARVHAGEIWIPRKAISTLLEELASLTDQRHGELSRLTDHPTENSPARPGKHLDGLTAREAEIARLLGRGHNNKEIASRLNVAEKTVKAHLTTVFRKLGFSSRLQLALFAADPNRVLAFPAAHNSPSS